MSVEKAVGAGVWSALDIGLRQIVQFGVSVILARLLAPEDFGLIALLVFFTSLSIVFVQGGLTTALVQNQSTTYEQENAAFWINLIAGAFFALILIAVAPLIARFYERPLLELLMFVAAAQVVLSALGAVHQALLTRTLRFDQLTKAGIFSSLVSAVAGVGAALAGWGVWALAVQLVAAGASNSAAVWWVSDWRPSWNVRLGQITGLARFGFHLSLSSAMEVIFTQGFLLVIGKVYGLSDLGIWNRATGVTQLPANIISQVISRTALPIFAARASDPDAVRRGFRLSLRLSMLLSLPLMVGLCVLSDTVVLALFGGKWLEAAPLMSVTVLSGMMLPLHVLNLNVLLALGESKQFLAIETKKKIFGVVVIGIGCFFGLMGVAVAALVNSIIAYHLNARPLEKLVGFGLRKQIADLAGVCLAAVAMGLGVYALKSYLPLDPWPTLGVLVPAGALIYLVAGFGFKIEAFKDALELVRSLVRRTLRGRRTFVEGPSDVTNH